MYSCRRALACLAVAALAGCKSEDTSETPTTSDIPDAAPDETSSDAEASALEVSDIPDNEDHGVVAVRTAGDGFWGSPFPSDRRGAMAILDFPNPNDLALIDQLKQMATETGGFAQTAGIFFPMTGAVGPLPTMAETVTETASVQLIDADPLSPERGRRVPLWVEFAADGGLYGSSNLLSLVPLQGAPLRRRTRHVAIVLRSLGDSKGHPLVVAQLDAETAGIVASVGIDLADVAGATAFTTGNSAATAITTTGEARKEGIILVEPPTFVEAFPTFCVYQGLLSVPNYQSGTPPYLNEGGTWITSADGTSTLVSRMDSRIVITVPRVGMPVPGYHAGVFIRTGGGGDRPLVDRGVHATPHGEATLPGSGPARDFAAVGLAGVMIDGPHGGPRNVSKGDEQFLVYNVLNPSGLRDNIRQSALEIALLPDLLAGLTLDGTGCTGSAASIRIDASSLALVGHSMGATIAPLVLAAEPRFTASVMSGAGSSFIENVLFKESPTPVKGIMEAMLGLTEVGESLRRGNPALNLVQWAGEPADPPPYGRLVREHPSRPHTLVVQGVVDTYILPTIAAATHLALGLDLGGLALDVSTPELAAYPSYASLLELVGGSAVALPARGNRDGTTQIVVQHAEDGIEDGHEAFFQLAAPKVQYRRFLETWAEGGIPEVP